MKTVGKASWIEFEGQWYYQLWDGNMSWTCDGGPDDKWEPAGPNGFFSDPSMVFDRIEYHGGPRQTTPPKLDRRGRPPRTDAPQRTEVKLSRWHRARLEEIAGKWEVDLGRAVERLIDNHKGEK